MTTITLKLKENSPAGPQKYRIHSETTTSYKIPREYIDKELSDKFYSELHRPGVYVLVGKRPPNNHTCIYIGQSDNLARRLYAHKGGQDGEKQNGKLFWQECLAFITTDYQLQKGHAEFFEAEFYRIAKEVNRYPLMNDNIPSVKTVSDDDMEFCEDFIEDCRLLSTLMGVPFLSPKERNESNNIISNSERLSLCNANHRGYDDSKFVDAKGYKCKTNEFDNGFIVLENSIISTEVSKKVSPSIKKLRNELMKRGYIREENSKLKFTQEYTFKSPGIAASIVLGRNASAADWKSNTNN